MKRDPDERLDDGQIKMTILQQCADCGRASNWLWPDHVESLKRDGYVRDRNAFTVEFTDEGREAFVSNKL